MAKTNAERQKEYRERKKKTDATFLDKEKRRAKRYRKLASELTRREHRKRLEANKLYCKTYRLKKSIQADRSETGQANSPIATSSNSQNSTPEPVPSTSGTVQTRSSSDKMIVAMPFSKRKSSGTRKAKATLLANTKRQVEYLRMKLLLEKKAKRRWQKRFERQNKAKGKSNVKTPTKSQEMMAPEKMTPRTITRNDLQSAGIKPSKVTRKLFKKLTLTNCLVAEIKVARNFNKSAQSRKQISAIACGRILKKYKCMKYLNKETGIGRNQIANVSETAKVLTRTAICRSTLKSKRVKEKVSKYFERDDISRCMPGKKDATKVSGKNVQTRILNDYLHNLHEKFRSENPDCKVSYSMFCRLRPKNVKLTSLLSRNTCLCTTHQNMALKLKCLRNMGIEISPNPETVSRTVTCEQMEASLTPMNQDEIEYEEWQKVDVDGKKRMRVIKVKKANADFRALFMKEYEKFLEHCSRVQAQYNALHTLKDKLPERSAIIQMDFAENFSCQSADEIQSAYWNSTMVTIHPVVIYYRVEGTLNHKNLAFVSNVNHHNTSAVVAIIEKLMPVVKELVPNIDTVHYWTDSPSSQYRNRYIFHVVENHQRMFGMYAVWNYFESGHGKSVCDGVGGACKRMAGEAVRQGKVSIQDGLEFYEWARKNEKSIEYMFYSEADYEKAVEIISNWNAKVVPGTMKLHAVRCVDGKLVSRTTSSYCDPCMTGICDT